MQHLLDKNTYKKLDSCINKKIQSNLLRFLRQHKMCFTEPECKFLNHKHHEVSSFYRLPKIHKSTIIESAINSEDSEIIEIFETSDLKLRPVDAGPKCPTRKPSQLIDILLKLFLKHSKRFLN